MCRDRSGEEGSPETGVDESWEEEAEESGRVDVERLLSLADPAYGPG